MKKSLTLFAAILFAAHVSAINYYQTYNIVVTSSSGNLQCQVYDYDLQQTQTWNSSIGTITQYFNNNGVVVFSSASTVGFVTYDLQLHQFKSWSNIYSAPITISVMDGVVAFNAGSTVGMGIYDITLGSWQVWSNIYSTPFNIYNSDGIVSFTAGSTVGAGVYDPQLKAWKTWTNIYSTPFSMINKDGTVAFTAGSTLGMLTYDANLQTWKTWSNIYSSPFQLLNEKGLVSFSASATVGFGTYDADLQAWKTWTNIYSLPIVLRTAGRVSAFAAGSTVGAVTYDPSAQSFKTWSNIFGNADTSTLSISSGTLAFQAGGSGHSAGYSNGSWSSSTVTAIQPYFYIYNHNSISNTQYLIHLRNMSIGATTVSFDFGDGISTTQNCLWHMYKINGVYRSQSYNVCLTAGNTGGSQNTCTTVTFDYAPTGIEEAPLANISIGPNPAGNSLYIKGITDKVQVAIISVDGKLIRSGKELSENEALDISALNNGIYFLSIQTQQGTATEKFVVSR